MSRAVTVVVTSYEDPRIEATLASLNEQSRAPDAVLVADGSGDPDFRGWLDDQAAEHGAGIVHEAGASVARARNLALEHAIGKQAIETEDGSGAGESGVLAFLDTDQRAPEGWLEALVDPIEAGRADWTGGPTQPIASLDLMALKEARLYEAAREDPTRIPMGNSAWATEVFDAVGGFDERLSMGGEDWDLALRARAAGFQGTLVEAAWVEHDLTGLDTYRDIARKQFRYNVGGAMAYMKNRSLVDRLGSSGPRVERHPFDLVEPVLKLLAVPVAWWRLKTADEPEHAFP